MITLTAAITNTAIPNFLSPPYNAIIPKIAAGIVIKITDFQSKSDQRKNNVAQQIKWWKKR
jgi:hypothetical protein